MLKKFFFRKVSISKWQFNLFGLIVFFIGFSTGFYFLTNKFLVPLIQAASTSQAWSFASAGDYSVGDSSFIEVASNVARLKSSDYSVDANTTALYHLNETSGTTANDSATSAHNATVTSGTWTSGKLDNAVNLDGVTSSLTAADSDAVSLTTAHTLETWVKFDNGFTADTRSKNQYLFDKGSYKLFYNKNSGKLQYELQDASATTWTQVAGQNGTKGWDTWMPSNIYSQAFVGGVLYVSLGDSTYDGDVWKYESGSWTQVGGDNLNGSWGTDYEAAYSLASDGTNLYAGLGLGGRDAEVWMWNGSTWTKIGGDGVNSSWAEATNTTIVYYLEYFGGNLYAGLGAGTTVDHIWMWNGSTWARIGGDGLNSSWNGTEDVVNSMTNDGTNLYVGLGYHAGEADVWRWNGTTWAQVGGDGTGSSWSASYETVTALHYFNGSLYAGLGTSAGDAELWKMTGSTWTKLGGDLYNSSWGSYNNVNSISDDGTHVLVGLGSTDMAEVWQLTGDTTWEKIGGDSLNNSFANYSDTVSSLGYKDGLTYATVYSFGFSPQVWTWDGSTWSMIAGFFVNDSWGSDIYEVTAQSSDDQYLYVGLSGYTDSHGVAGVYRYDGTNWERIGGQGKNSSWEIGTKSVVRSLYVYKGKLYAGLGWSTDDAEIWEWNGSSWTRIAGNAEGSSWNSTSDYETVYALTGDDTYLYAGVGTGNDADVWRWDGTTWSKIGGEGVGWATVGLDEIHTMTMYNGNLIVGAGTGTAEADVWQWDGSSWTEIADSGDNNWTADKETVMSLAVYSNELYAGLGHNTGGDAEVWKWSGSGNTWTKVGGDGYNSSWIDGPYETVETLTEYNGYLYAGLSYGGGESEIWRWDGTTWVQIGGDNLNGSWYTTPYVTRISTLVVANGKLYAGMGAGGGTAMVWEYGNNRILQSTQTSQDTSWHHIAATYDGSTMKLYVDGSLDNSLSSTVTMPDNNKQLWIGSSMAGDSSSSDLGRFDGSLDEIRISNVARSSFISSAYSSSAQTVQISTAYNPVGLNSWSGFETSETTNGDTIKYRLSNDDGLTWKYWLTDQWITSSSTSQSNTAAEINSNISSFPVTSDGLIWQAILQGDGDQQVTLNSVTVHAELDSTAPPTNATSVSVTGLGSGNWISSEPTITWEEGADNNGGAGILGYCISLDEATLSATQSTSLNPQTTAGSVFEVNGSVLDDGVNSDACPYIVSGSSINLSNISGLTLSSGKQYFFSIKAVDQAGNVYAGSASNYQDLAVFKLDSTPPSNPSYISLPGDFVASKAASISWPTSASQGASDSESGIAGMQYRIGTSGTWYGDSHNGAQDSTDLLSNDGNYDFSETYDFDTITEGTNLIQFRTYDNAGNVSSSVITGLLKINTNAPSSPTNLSVDPATNTENLFSFDWDVPDTYSGNIDNFTYCYTINTLPSATSCNWTEAGVTQLASDAYANQPGENTIYLVSKSDSGTVSYGDYASLTFTANTSAPGIPQNADVADVSVKETSSWKLAVAWEAPASLGAGVSYYQVYHSIDNSSFSLESTVYDISYVDTGLTQQTHYYKVRACDSANNCGAFSPVVSLYPDGKYTSAPKLNSGPAVSSITTKKATISWTTSRSSDSKVAFGTKTLDYNDEEPSNSDQVTDHVIKLSNLAPGTTYYYVAKWTDEDGNTGESDEKTFTTSPAPSVSAAEESDIGLSSALLSFTVKDAVKVKIMYGQTANYGGVKEVTTSTLESSYSVKLSDLSDGTQYHYKLVLVDSEGDEYSFEDHVFETLPQPRVSNIEIEEIRGSAQPAVLVTWESNTDISSIISYYPTDSPKNELSQVELDLIKGDHKMLIKNLRPETRYNLVVKGRDKAGNEATSSIISFTTATDTRPPIIYDFKVTGSILGQGSEAQAQLVVSFNTDEDASTQVEFGEGSEQSYSQRTQLDGELTTYHFAVVPNLQPSRVYHLRVLTKDAAGNETKSIDKVMVTPKSTDNALDLVITNLSDVFGFLKK
ncbi:MAG: LamG-like jellyroll fold domain-containing protein [Patescibacteria group bacterium]